MFFQGLFHTDLSVTGQHRKMTHWPVFIKIGEKGKKKKNRKKEITDLFIN